MNERGMFVCVLCGKRRAREKRCREKWWSPPPANGVLLIEIADTFAPSPTLPATYCLYTWYTWKVFTLIWWRVPRTRHTLMTSFRERGGSEDTFEGGKEHQNQRSKISHQKSFWQIYSGGSCDCPSAHSTLLSTEVWVLAIQFARLVICSAVAVAVDQLLQSHGSEIQCAACKD